MTAKKRQYWDNECTSLNNNYINALEKEQRTGRAEDKAETAAKKKEYDLKLKTLKKENTAAHINQAQNKSKALWQVINNERKATRSTENQLMLQINGEQISDPHEVANHFNTFFATVADRTLQANNTNPNSIPQVIPPITDHNLQFHPTTHAEVMKAIDSLKPKTSSGIDEISAKITKECKEALTGPLTNIINKSLNQGVFPTKLKTAKIYPKYKKGPETDTGSYRPNLTHSHILKNNIKNCSSETTDPP